MQILTEKNQLVLVQKQSGRWQMKHPRYDCDAGDAATNEAQERATLNHVQLLRIVMARARRWVTCSLLDPKPS